MLLWKLEHVQLTNINAENVSLGTLWYQVLLCCKFYSDTVVFWKSIRSCLRQVLLCSEIDSHTSEEKLLSTFITNLLWYLGCSALEDFFKPELISLTNFPWSLSKNILFFFFLAYLSFVVACFRDLTKLWSIMLGLLKPYLKSGLSFFLIWISYILWWKPVYDVAHNLTKYWRERL